MQPCLSVQVLSLEPQVLLFSVFLRWDVTLIQAVHLLARQALHFPLFTDCATPGLVIRLPHQLPLGIGEFLRQPCLIGVEVVNVAQLGFGSRFLRCACLCVQSLPVLGFCVIGGRLLRLMVFFASSAYVACAGSYGFRSVFQFHILCDTQPALLCCLALCVQPRQRHVAPRLVHVADDTLASALFDEPHAFPDEDRGAERVVFGDSAAYGVVVECCGLRGRVFCAWPSRGCDLGEIVLFIPSEALVGVLACEFADEPAMAIVKVAFVFKHPHQVVAHVAALGQRCAAVHCLLGGAVLDVAGGVVAEAFIGGLWQWAADTSQCSMLGLQDAPGGVVLVGDVSTQTVAAGA